MARSDWHKGADGAALHWPVDRYRDEGERRTRWFVDGVVKYHRTVETYVNGLLDAGLRLVRLEEPEADAALLAEKPEWQQERRRPPFLLLAADRPRSSVRAGAARQRLGVVRTGDAIEPEFLDRCPRRAAAPPGRSRSRADQVRRSSACRPCVRCCTRMPVCPAMATSAAGRSRPASIDTDHASRLPAARAQVSPPRRTGPPRQTRRRPRRRAASTSAGERVPARPAAARSDRYRTGSSGDARLQIRQQSDRQPGCDRGGASGGARSATANRRRRSRRRDR